MPVPREGESRSDFVSRCVAIRQRETNGRESTEQSVAICHSMFQEAVTSKRFDTLDRNSFVHHTARKAQLRAARERCN